MKRMSAKKRLAVDAKVLFASLVLTEPLINPNQMRLAKRIVARAEALAARRK